MIRHAVFSSPRDKKGAIRKVVIRPLSVKGKHVYQETRYTGEQAFHRNLSLEEIDAHLATLHQAFRQAVISTDKADEHFYDGKKVASKPPTHAGAIPVHNRNKPYLLNEGEPIPFLVALDVMDAHGKVKAAKRDKFIQVNRFLELIQDLAFTSPLKAIDFGCGKGVLTFGLYYYLTQVRGLEVDLMGIDQKSDLMGSNQAIADQLGFQGLRFVAGHLEDQKITQVDLVVALHACDTATDVALDLAIRAQARFILASPCCQQALAESLSHPDLEPLLRYPYFRQKLNALLTDGGRLLRLEACGYDVQAIEFVDPEHTPKNLLLKARFRGKKGEAACSFYTHFFKKR